MKILVDASAGQAIADALRVLGHDVLSVRDRDPRMPDADILSWAVADDRLVVTIDKDFGELVFRTKQAHAGVLLLRLDDAPERRKGPRGQRDLQQARRQTSRPLRRLPRRSASHPIITP